MFRIASKMNSDCQKQTIRPSDIVVLKSNDNSFEEFYSKQLLKIGVRVLDISILRGGQYNIGSLKQLIAVPNSIWSLKPMLKDCKLIIVFGVNRIDGLELKLSKPKSCAVAVWYWNTIDSHDDMTVAGIASQDDMDCFTFDSGDAKRCRIKKIHQFFPFKSDEHLSISDDSSRSAFFVGEDKGRWELLVSLFDALDFCGYNCDFNVISVESSGGKKHPEWVRNSFMPYTDVLDHVAANDVVVDFMKPGQRGMTVRCLEALQYGKKIITNNPMLMEAAVWNPNNVFMIGQDMLLDKSALASFLEKPYDPSQDAQLKSQYSMQNWLEQIVVESLGTNIIL